MAYREPAPDRLQLWPRFRDDYMSFKGYSPNSVTCMRQVYCGLTEHQHVDLADVRVEHLRAYLNKTSERRPYGPLSRAARHTYTSHFRTLYGWAVKHGHLDTDPTLHLESPKVQPGDPHPIDPAKLSHALATATRNVRCWLMLGAHAGLRCGEAAGLRGENVYLDHNPRLVVVGKGGKVRGVPLHPDLVRELATWPRTGYLFPGQKDGHIGPKWVSSAVNRHLRSLGYPDVAHSTRHRFGTDMYQGTGDPFQAMKLLGHANVSTTMIYAQVDQSGLYSAVASQPSFQP